MARNIYIGSEEDAPELSARLWDGIHATAKPARDNDKQQQSSEQGGGAKGEKKNEHPTAINHEYTTSHASERSRSAFRDGLLSLGLQVQRR